MAWFIFEMRRMMKRFGKEKVGSNPSHSRGCSIRNARRLTQDPTRATGKHWSKSKTKVLWQYFGEKINLRWLFSCTYVHEQRISKGGNTGKFVKCFIHLTYFTNLLKFDSNLLTRLSPNILWRCLPSKGLVSVHHTIPVVLAVRSQSRQHQHHLETHWKWKFSGPNQDLLTRKHCGWSPGLWFQKPSMWF